MPEKLTYKLPAPFLDTIGDLLTMIDWDTQQTATVELPDASKVRLEAVKGRHGAIVIRPADLGSATRIRRLADTIAAAQPDKYPRQSEAETQRVISMRNPADIQE